MLNVNLHTLYIGRQLTKYLYRPPEVMHSGVGKFIKMKPFALASCMAVHLAKLQSWH